MTGVIIRSIEDIIKDNIDELRLIFDDNEIKWVDDKDNDLPYNRQVQLFEKYNSSLYQVINCLNNQDSFTRAELSLIFGVNINSLNYFILNNFKGEIPRREKIGIRDAFALSSELMPLIEGWKPSRVVAAEFDISQGSVNNYCRRDKVENKYVLKKYRVSPIGVEQLRIYMGLDNLEAFSTLKVARKIGCTQTAIIKHAKDLEVCPTRYKKCFQWTQSDFSYLQNAIRTNQNSFEFANSRYYSISSIADQILINRGVEESKKEYFVKRLSNLRKYDELTKVRKSGKWFFDESSKDVLVDLILQSEAEREFGLKRHIIANRCDKGIIKTYKIGPTRWLSYSSCLEFTGC